MRNGTSPPPTAVPTPDPIPAVPEFQTGNTNFAAALIAANQLKYLRAQRLPRATVFIFEDLHGVGPELERRFVRDVFPHVSPRGFSQARAFLVEEIDRLAGRVRGVPHEQR